MNTAGLAILNLRLAGSGIRGDPYVAVVNHLEAYFPPPGDANDGGLSTLNLEFNIDPSKVKDLQSHQAAVAGFVKRMCQ